MPLQTLPERILIIMTFGKGNYSKIPLNNLARPYGSVTRSRYRKGYCTEEAFEMISKGYTGEAYYFLRVIKSGQNYLLPLRKININSSSMEGDRVYVDYNLLDYSFIINKADAATVFERLKGEMEKEPAKFNELLVFCASKKDINSLVSCGTSVECWLKTVIPVKEIIPKTEVMDAKSKKPLIMSTFIKNTSNSPVITYNNEGIKLNSGGTYKIVTYLDMLDDQPYSKVRMALATDEESIKGMIGKTEFFTSYDKSELVFCVAKKLVKFIDTPLISYLDITFKSKGTDVLPPDINFSIVIMPRYFWHYRWHLAFFVGVVIATTITYWEKIIADPTSIYTLYLFLTIFVTMITTMALGKISS
jgi:hypothetical protein